MLCALKNNIIFAYLMLKIVTFKAYIKHTKGETDVAIN